MKILLFGSSGFFGKHIKEALLKDGHQVHETHGRNRYNLLSSEQTRTAFLDSKPDLVVHVAGHNGGLEFNRKYPADILTKNILMATNVVEQAKNFSVKKVVLINAVCAYPDKYKQSMSEENFLDGEPDKSVEFHAYSKRYLVNIAEAYNQQYGMQISNLCFTNLFGPECSFDPVKSKVVEAVIKKLVDAKINDEKEVVFWGTGSPKREFMFAPDAAKYVSKLINESGFLNIGTGKSISIKGLVSVINKLVGYKGKIIWDTTMPDGQPERVLNIDKFLNKVELELTPFEEAIQETINFYILKNGYSI